MGRRSYFDTWHYRLRLFGRTIHHDPGGLVEEQPTLKIRLLRIRSFFASKLPAMGEVFVGFLVFAGLPIFIFSAIYHLLGVPGEWWDQLLSSFYLFTWNVPGEMFGNVVLDQLLHTQVEGLSPGQVLEVTTAIDNYTILYWVAWVESILGKITDAVFLAAMTAAMLKPINRLWVPGRFTYNGKRIDSQDLRDVNKTLDKALEGTEHSGRWLFRRPGREYAKKVLGLFATDQLEFSYWIRLTEKEWLHHVTTTLRVQSDEDDRQIKLDPGKPLPMFEYAKERIMRRGTNYARVTLDAKGVNGTEEWALLEILTKVMLACFGLEYAKARGFSPVQDPSRGEDASQHAPFEVWSAKDGRLEPFDPDPVVRRAFRNYQFQFRVAGTSDEGYEMDIERKYSIYDIIYPYTFCEIEMPSRQSYGKVHPKSLDGLYIAVQPAAPGTGADFQVEATVRIKGGKVKSVKCCKLFRRESGRPKREAFGKGELPQRDLAAYATRALEHPEYNMNEDKVRRDAGPLLDPVFEAIDYCCDSARATPYHSYRYRYTNVWMVRKSGRVRIGRAGDVVDLPADCCEEGPVDIKRMTRNYEQAFELLDRLLVMNKAVAVANSGRWGGFEAWRRATPFGR